MLRAGRPLRVLAIIDNLNVAGAQRVLAEEARAFDPRRVSLRVIALAHSSGLGIADKISACRVPVHVVAGRGLVDIRRLFRLARLIRRWRPDVVHTQLSYANIVGILAARLARRPVVASIQNVTTDQTRLDTPKRLLQGLALRLAERTIVVAQTAVEESRRNFLLPPDRLVVIPNAIDLRRLEPPPRFDRTAKRQELGVAADAEVLCVIARLDPYKGHRYLLEAAAKLASRRPAACYLLVGTGPVEAALRAQASTLGLEDRVHFLGIRPDVPEILAASDLFVLPSLNEGLSLAILEAMALGVPVVATAVGGAADVLVHGETGWTVRPSDPTALAQAIDQALRDPVETAARATKGREVVRREFSIVTHVARLEAIYREVLDSDSAALSRD
jgi:glycosyltransferase involved in cell wall biosynthesis